MLNQESALLSTPERLSWMKPHPLLTDSTSLSIASSTIVCNNPRAARKGKENFRPKTFGKLAFFMAAQEAKALLLAARKRGSPLLWPCLCTMLYRHKPYLQINLDRYLRLFYFLCHLKLI
ncbi:hypothetical protein CEXT_779401 [Caerostris extrusa]|uniref:Uncharacterized protein n=1 Tax=Caerostris extrusa TaxID=172846 RepID=A0AAV4XC52_CAEEX|nr:hypothetical protein CEXT_779401 [Caerostris extrusa]